ncbi:peroxisomal membrane protein PEX14 [Tetranychus urticae]|uniref:peroxisomal membrane protein PEX14 n=1 Tax=Tetranychus urticae TaxID=32264 RepID=UPI00077B85E1|nr:peroxisomal membrane protein PEX14 [Tetranychus urticae]
MESNEADSNGMESQMVLRDDLIKTAVDFLKIPKVANSSIDKKKSFLRSKGLNDDEIDVAFLQSGISGYGHGDMAVAERSAWSSLARFTFSTAIIGGIFYGGYHLYKKYIQPKILQYFSDRLDTIESKLDNIVETVKKLETESANDKLNIMKTSRPNAAEIHAINELKTEISSVKALILSKNSFPMKPSSEATIPSWQLDEPVTNGIPSVISATEEDDD